MNPQQYAVKNSVKFLAELKHYLKFRSISAQSKHKKDLLMCAEFIADHCKQIGLFVKLHKTSGNPIVIAKTFNKRSAGVPHFIIYGHYDVQPVEPVSLWKSDPFEAIVKGDNLIARGSSDNKGQHFAHIKAIESYIKTGTSLPCDITFLLEGEEEVGSESLSIFLREHKKELACDAVVISDSSMPVVGVPALTYSLRGIAAFEIIVRGPDRDLHSGSFGGAIENPAMSLSKILANIRDENGRIRIPGFYDGVKKLSSFERKELARTASTPEDFRKFTGAPDLFGEKGFAHYEQTTARPTFEINGLTSGYQGEGSKTIIPSWAKAKITMRLVGKQNPQKIFDDTKKYIENLAQSSVSVEIIPGHLAEPYEISLKNRLVSPIIEVLTSVFNKKPCILREGGSIPVVNDFKKILGVESLLIGLGLPTDNAHSPNEQLNLKNFKKGIELGIELWKALAKK